MRNRVSGMLSHFVSSVAALGRRAQTTMAWLVMWYAEIRSALSNDVHVINVLVRTVTSTPTSYTSGIPSESVYQPPYLRPSHNYIVPILTAICDNFNWHSVAQQRIEVHDTWHCQAFPHSLATDDGLCIRPAHFRYDSPHSVFVLLLFCSITHGAHGTTRMIFILDLIHIFFGCVPVSVGRVGRVCVSGVCVCI